MGGEGQEKEVYFDQYCPTCLHKKKKENEKPCFKCLQHPSNTDSHKPIKWQKKC